MDKNKTDYSAAKTISKPKVTVSISQKGHEIIEAILTDFKHLRHNRTAAIELALEDFDRNKNRATKDFAASSLLEDIKALVEQAESESTDSRLQKLQDKLEMVDRQFGLLNHLSLITRDLYRRVGFTPALMDMRTMFAIINACHATTPVNVSEHYRGDWFKFAEMFSQALRGTDRRLLHRISTFINVASDFKDLRIQLGQGFTTPGIIDLFTLLAVTLQATGQVIVKGFPGRNTSAPYDIPPISEGLEFKKLKMPTLPERDS